MLACVLLVVVLQETDPLLGPAGAERILRDALEDVALHADSKSAALDRLTQARARCDAGNSGQDLLAALDAAAALIEARQTRPDLAGLEPGLAFLITRSLALPTPAAWLDPGFAWTASPPASLALLEWIAKAPRAASLPLMRQLNERGRQQRLSPTTHAAVLHHLGQLESLEGAEALYSYYWSANAALRFFSRRGFQRLMERTRRRHDYGAAAGLYQDLVSKLSSSDALRIEAAGQWLRSPEQFLRARPLLERVAENLDGRVDTDSILRRREALLGQAICAVFAKEPPQRWEAAFAAALESPRSPFEQEDGLLILASRIHLVRGIFRVLESGNDQHDLTRAIELTPKIAGKNTLDEAFFGMFGPKMLSLPLRRRGDSEGLVEALELLVSRIEESSAETGFGTRLKDPEREERAASWIVLHLSKLILEDLGDPARARQLMEERLQNLENMNFWVNLRLLVHVRLQQARCFLFAEEADNARLALDAALETTGGLQRGLARYQTETRDMGEPIAMPVSTNLWKPDQAYASLAATVRLSRHNLFATLIQDHDAATAELYAAGEWLEWGDQRWMATALNYAGRGLDEFARRALTCVEVSPERYYDLACCYARLGDTRRALQLVEMHLTVNVFTKAGRRQQIEYMFRDPDLASIHEHLDFPPTTDETSDD